MRSRIPALLALALALCALPGVRAFASAPCAPCCAEYSAPAPDCAMDEAPCCEIAPAAPAAIADHARAEIQAPAVVDSLRVAEPALAPVPAPPAKGAPAYSSPLRLSVVRLL
ncbi:MAG TPA: hypothetical protein VKH41_06000 [Myxococcota bacterium]|nr:hypothetical protein [Myxococcota bacterium]